MKPYKCPVCEGRGTVPPSLYGDPFGSTAVIEEVKCRSCDGTGIVWYSEVVDAIGKPVPWDTRIKNIRIVARDPHRWCCTTDGSCQKGVEIGG